MKPCKYLYQGQVGRGHETRITGCCSNETILHDRDGGDFSDGKLETSVQSCQCCKEYSAVVGPELEKHEHA